MTKTELEEEIRNLCTQLALSVEDYKRALDRLEKLERRNLLIRVRVDGVTLDAVVIPPSGRCSSPVTTDFIDDDTGVELLVEPIE